MKRVYGFAAVLCATLLLAGCGKSGSETGQSGASADESGPVVRRNGVATVHITGNDQMKYNLNAFTVHPGEKVRVIFENVGSQPKQTMGHDFVLLKSGEDYKKFANDVQAGGNPAEHEISDTLLEKTIAHTKILGPGESATVEFTAPAAGDYPYLCTFPGHFVFMHGVMTVK